MGTQGEISCLALRGENWILSLAKRWAVHKLGDAANLQVRLDAFDALNNPNFANPNGAIGTPAVGIINGANTSRDLQVGAKFVF